MRKEILLPVLIFLSLVAENDTVLAYYHELWTPARLFEWYIFVLPFKLTPFQLACLAMLLLCRRSGDAPPKPVSRALWVSFSAVILWMAYGLILGGVLKPIFTQTIAWLSCLLISATAMKVLSTVADFRRLENAIVWAGIWRACIAITFYMQVRGRSFEEMPPHMTTHEDTVVFVVALLVLVSRAIEMRTGKALRLLILAAPLIVLAIQFNNRRLAWASLAAGLAVIYFMLPAKSKAARRVNRALLIASPLLALYVAIGWGRSESIFKPLQSLASMSASTEKDNSTKARDNENVSLLVMIAQAPLLGTGLGHEWIELDSSFTVPESVFPMYHYCPHNSVLALVAFCGVVGVAALWMIIYVAVYLSARTYRHSRDPAERSVAVIAIVDVVAYLNQAFGDMGAMGPTHIVPATVLACGIAGAAKLSLSSGAWPSARKSAGQPRSS